MAWCPLSKIQRIEFLIITNGSINPWFEIILWNYWHTLCYRIENNDKLCHLSIIAWKWIVIAQVERFFHLRWIKNASIVPSNLYEFFWKVIDFGTFVKSWFFAQCVMYIHHHSLLLLDTICTSCYFFGIFGDIFMFT